MADYAEGNPHPGAVTVARLLDAVRGDIDHGNMHDCFTPAEHERIGQRIKDGDFDYIDDRFGDLAKHYRPLPVPRRGADGSTLIELARITPAPPGPLEPPPRIKVEFVPEEDDWRIDATGWRTPRILAG